MPASNSSGTSTTAALGAGRSARTASSHAAMRAPTSGHNRLSNQLRSSSAPANAFAAMAARSTTPPGAISAPHRSMTASTTSFSPYSSCTTASVESTCAPSSASAFSAVDLPAPMPPVRPTNDTTGCTGTNPSVLGWLAGRLLGVGLSDRRLDVGLCGRGLYNRLLRRNLCDRGLRCGLVRGSLLDGRLCRLFVGGWLLHHGLSD